MVRIYSIKGQPNSFVIYCDFCAKSQEEVSSLIASPNGTHICNECVTICAEIVADENAADQQEGEGA